MRFEGRDLTSYAQPVEPGTLTPGETYFTIQYADSDLLIPIMETIVFVGRDLDPDDPGRLYFQDVECHRMGIKYGSGSWEETGFRTCREDGANYIFEFERALEELMKCSLRRHAAKSSG